MAVSKPPSIDLEHLGLDRALGEVEFLAQRRSFTAASTCFDAFRALLEAHLAHEETLTFPEYERRTHDPSVLKTLRAQHQNLTAQLQRMGTTLTWADYPAFCIELGVLDRLLTEHQGTEEWLLPARPAAR